MHVCFHGGAGDSKITKSVSIIRGFTKNMKAMSLKVKVGGGGNQARARRRRQPEADDTVQDYKDVAAAPAASASAKIAPAQLQEEADDDHQLRSEEEEEQGGGKKQEYCDKCCSPLLDDGGGGAKEETAAAAIVKAKEVAEESGREWVSEPEPGVVMTLAPRPDGTNRLRRIRFREALFDAWAAQSWWADNYDRVVELYSVVQSDEEEEEEEAAAAAVPVTPCQSEEEEELPDGMTGAEESGSPWTSNFTGGSGSGGGSAGTVGSPILGLVTAPNTSGNGSTTTRAAQHDSTCQQPTTAWREWVEEYEAGVFITVRAYPDHHLQLRHVELSRERFGEVKARVWWQENKARLHHLYSF